MRSRGLTGIGTGFPDVVMMPDWSTLVPVPWENDLSAVIADVHTKEGEPLDVEPRRQLRKAVDRLDATEFEALFGVAGRLGRVVNPVLNRKLFGERHGTIAIEMALMGSRFERREINGSLTR